LLFKLLKLSWLESLKDTSLEYIGNMKHSGIYVPLVGVYADAHLLLRKAIALISLATGMKFRRITLEVICHQCFSNR
jgi:hypothetical protein